MRRRWIRNQPDSRDNAMAAVAAAGVGAVLGAVLFYLGRLFLAREPVRPPGQVEGGPRKGRALQVEAGAPEGRPLQEEERA